MNEQCFSINEIKKITKLPIKKEWIKKFCTASGTRLIENGLENIYLPSHIRKICEIRTKELKQNTSMSPRLKKEAFNTIDIIDRAAKILQNTQPHGQ